MIDPDGYEALKAEIINTPELQAHYEQTKARVFECAVHVDADASTPCGYLADDASDLARHRADLHPQDEQAVYDADHWPQIIAQLRAALHREIAYRERLERELHRHRPVTDVARFWHHARGWHRAPWLNRLKAAVVDMESKPDALLD